jgi:hypothetical protein
MPVDSVQKEDGRGELARFSKGQSGNPAGRPAEGAITPGEAAELVRVVEIFVRATDTSDSERRLQQVGEPHGASA